MSNLFQTGEPTAQETLIYAKAEPVTQKAEIRQKTEVRQKAEGLKLSGSSLQRGIVMSVILGEPASRKRHKSKIRERL